jgi:hypothetical protein
MNTPGTTPAQTPKPEERPKVSPMIGRSKNFKIAALAVGAVLLIFVSFAAGVGVGLRKARFSSDFGRNYERNFIGSRMMGGRQDGFIEGMMREFSGRDFRNANGLAGTIISITNNNLVVKDRDNKENTVVVTDKTAIKLGRNNAQLSDLKQNDQVVVIGQPGNNGVINADLIRVFPGNVNPASSELNNNTQNN